MLYRRTSACVVTPIAEPLIVSLEVSVRHFLMETDLPLKFMESDFGLVWGGILIFDSAVFILTAYKSVALWRRGTRGLVHIIMRDGEFL